jgi:hypothetical protein
MANLKMLERIANPMVNQSLNFENHQKFHEMHSYLKRQMSSTARKSVIDIIDKREVINEKLLKSRKSLVEYDS